MKVFIHYKPKRAESAFEGTRLRKNLKGECEEVDVTWTDNKLSDPDIAHFISPYDIALLRKFREKGVKTIVSAFYCERDPYASFIKLNRRGMHLKKRAKAMLNEADLVLVPNEKIKDFAEKSGVSAPIAVVPASVNPERFVLAPLEREVFYRYFGVREDTKLVVCNGSYSEHAKLRSLIKIAKLCPQVRFYFFGFAGVGMGAVVRFYQNRAPENLTFAPLLEDDVYRSALERSSAYLVLNSLPDGVGLLEAFASKSVVIAMGDQSLNPLIVKDVSAFLVKNEQEVAEVIDNIYLGKGKDTIIASYAAAKKYSLAKQANTLKTTYEAVLKPQEE